MSGSRLFWKLVMIGAGVIVASQRGVAAPLSLSVVESSSSTPASAPAGVSVLTTTIVFAVMTAIMLSVLFRRGVFSPSRLKRLRVRDPKRIPALGWLTMFVGGYLLWQIGAGLGVNMAIFYGAKADSIMTQSMGLWVGFVFIAAALVVVFKLNAAELIAAGFGGAKLDGLVGLGAFLLSAPCVMFVMLVSAQIGAMVRGHPVGGIQHDLLATIASAPHTLVWWTLIGAVTVAAPIVEEILYRGCLQSAIGGATGSPMIAIVATSAVFASAHVGTVTPEALAGLFVLGIAFGLGFEHTGRISVPIVMHAAFNGMNVFQSLSIG